MSVVGIVLLVLFSVCAARVLLEFVLFGVFVGAWLLLWGLVLDGTVLVVELIHATR